MAESAPAASRRLAADDRWPPGLPSPADASQAHPARQGHVSDGEVLLVGITGQLERVVTDSQVAGRSPTVDTVDLCADLDERRQVGSGSLLPGQDGTEAGIGDRRVELLARHHDGVGNAVAGILRIQVPHHRELLEVFREVGHLVGELDSRQRGVNHAELAPDLRLGFGLRVGTFVVAGSAPGPDQDAVDVRGLRLVLRGPLASARNSVSSESPSPPREPTCNMKCRRVDSQSLVRSAKRFNTADHLLFGRNW
ncbi:MAG: hypothetical protein CM1200mP2_24240 [Planctomycetaceae bacterium]|nr:MAG: hypothetical protein CM1200mP2_24240 [Planctomycetaceae bacterium]